MAVTEVHSNKVVLNDRTLWFDGDSTVSPDQIIKLLSKGVSTDNIYVDHLNDQVRKFNRNVPFEQQIKTKNHVQPLSFEWNIPSEYIQMDLYQWMIDQLSQQIDSDEQHHYVTRCVYEYRLYQHHQLLDTLKALLYIINTLQTNGVVWGVGRGSSVSSYLLYLMGVHDVDSVFYQLDIHDFLSPIK